jgi:hypothetical protein
MSNTPSVPGELVVDDRGRANLAKVRSTSHTRYRVEEFPGGILLLVPLRSEDDAEVPEGMRSRLSAPLTSSETKVKDWRS